MSGNSQPLFNIAQTFFLDPSVANKNASATLTSVDLFFEYMPAANTNQSGINLPGVTLYFTDTIYGVPRISQDTFNQFARCEYYNIQTSSDATVGTKFTFNQPVQVIPGSLYAVLLSYDGNETFVPWTAVNKQWEIGTRNVYTGGGNLIGEYFEFVSPGDIVNNPTNAQTQQEYLSFWSPLDGTQLKFQVNAARYFVNSVPVAFANLATTTLVHRGNFLNTWNPTTETFTYVFPDSNVEGIAFDINQSTVQSYIGAQRCFQNTVPFPGGPTSALLTTNGSNIIVSSNTNFPNGSAFNWNRILSNSYSGATYIVLQNPSGGQNVRLVTSFLSNTVIQVDEPVTFSNNQTTFFISPVGTVDSTLSASPYGFLDNLLYLNHSNANSSVRFVDYRIENVANSTSGSNAYGGSGYSNSDVLFITGYEYVSGKRISGYYAYANLQTNSAGGIQGVFLANLGSRFVNSSSIVPVVLKATDAGAVLSGVGLLTNSTSNSSSGSGATFTYTVGSTLKTEYNNNIFKNCIVSDFSVDDVTPYFNIFNPVGTNYTMDMSSEYTIVTDNSVYNGRLTQAVSSDFTVAINQDNFLISNTPMAFVSHSNEFYTCYANGATSTLANAASPYSNAFILNVRTTSNNDYLAVDLMSQPSIELGKFIINNDYSGENTNSGNAWAKHLTTLVNFQNLTEDLLIYVTAFRPINTDIQVFARIQNVSDPETFINEDWTRLALIGNNVISSFNDPTDYVELAYGFQKWPNTAFTLAGSVQTINNSANVIGSNTSFSSNLAAGNLVRVYAPLFSNNDYIVASVNNVVNNTLLILDQVITSNVSIGGNPALVANGSASLAIDKLAYPFQAFNNINNSNVVRYYNTSIVHWDNYQNLQIKVVLLSSKMTYVPQLNSLRATGVSA